MGFMDATIGQMMTGETQQFAGMQLWAIQSFEVTKCPCGQWRVFLRHKLGGRRIDIRLKNGKPQMTLDAAEII